MRYANRRDENQAEIEHALRMVGALVFDTSRLGGGFPDLVCGFRDTIYMLEVKTERGRLNRLEREFHDDWHGYVHVVRNVDEALALLGAL